MYVNLSPENLHFSLYPSHQQTLTLLLLILILISLLFTFLFFIFLFYHFFIYFYQIFNLKKISKIIILFMV